MQCIRRSKHLLTDGERMAGVTLCKLAVNQEDSSETFAITQTCERTGRKILPNRSDMSRLSAVMSHGIRAKQVVRAETMWNAVEMPRWICEGWQEAGHGSNLLHQCNSKSFVAELKVMRRFPSASARKPGAEGPKLARSRGAPARARAKGLDLICAPLVCTAEIPGLKWLTSTYQHKQKHVALGHGRCVRCTTSGKLLRPGGEAICQNV